MIESSLPQRPIDTLNAAQHFQNRLGFKILVRKISNFLVEEGKCTPEVFEIIKSSLKSPSAITYDEYASLLGDISSSKFAFTDDQLQEIAHQLVATYFSISKVLNRLALCFFFGNVFTTKKALIFLGNIANLKRKRNRSHSELLWVLNCIERSNAESLVDKTEASRIAKIITT